MKKVTAIFDIGKTNKKLFLFDKNFDEVYSEYKVFNEIKDEDGYPCDDLLAIQQWIITCFKKILKQKKYKVKALNFSTYGASMIHLDQNGKPLTALYNYTKPIAQKYIDLLYTTHGGIENLSRETASPPSAMLNSGIQLFWLKNRHPSVFAKIKYSLHLPQYLSYIFTGVPVSDYTSLGCHTMLWNYDNKDYHPWVMEEGLDKILAPIVDTRMSFNINYEGTKLKIGTGIHDSSSALLPFLVGNLKPFILLSTGTWSVTLNPFNAKSITHQELEQDCLNYMSVDGRAVRASRLFLGNEYNQQIEKLSLHFNVDPDYHKKIKFSKKIFKNLKTKNKRVFHFESMASTSDQPIKTEYQVFENFEEAYHKLMHELVLEQVASTRLTFTKNPVDKIYIEGGFAENDLFVKMLSLSLKALKVRRTKSPSGSALGAALMVNDTKLEKSFIKKKYKLRK